ncbi:hypothetical protein [Streptomyces sp. NPDC060065]|uniref:hypothetical protein n=1 Tax=Streptomyces sp. NPDC060065 TaxID=3347050 RepID=UPI00368AE2DE
MPGQATYTAAKAGLVGLSRALALEVVGDGVEAELCVGLAQRPLREVRVQSTWLTAGITPVRSMRWCRC